MHAYVLNQFTYLYSTRIQMRKWCVLLLLFSLHFSSLFALVVINVNVILSTCWRRSITLCVRQNKEQHHCMRLRWMTFKQNKWYFIPFSFLSAFFTVSTTTTQVSKSEHRKIRYGWDLSLRSSVIEFLSTPRLISLCNCTMHTYWLRRDCNFTLRCN